MEVSAPSELTAAARRETLAGLLSPANKFPDGKSRPVTLLSGSREPHGAPPVGHTETVTLQPRAQQQHDET